jgi:hypothetical protein
MKLKLLLNELGAPLFSLHLWELRHRVKYPSRVNLLRINARLLLFWHLCIRRKWKAIHRMGNQVTGVRERFQLRYVQYVPRTNPGKESRGFEI